MLTVLCTKYEFPQTVSTYRLYLSVDDCFVSFHIQFDIIAKCNPYLAIKFKSLTLSKLQNFIIVTSSKYGKYYSTGNVIREHRFNATTKFCSKNSGTYKKDSQGWTLQWMLFL